MSVKDTNHLILEDTPKKYDVLISKSALGGEEIAGATIRLVDADGNQIDEWVSSAEGPHTVQLLAGEYTMTEVVAPEGYQTVTTEMKFKVDAEGNVELLTVEVDGNGAISANGNHITLEDALIPVAYETERPEEPKKENPETELKKPVKPETPATFARTGDATHTVALAASLVAVLASGFLLFRRKQA